MWNTRDVLVEYPKLSPSADENATDLFLCEYSNEEVRNKRLVETFDYTMEM